MVHKKSRFPPIRNISTIYNATTLNLETQQQRKDLFMSQLYVQLTNQKQLQYKF